MRLKQKVKIVRTEVEEVRHQWLHCRCRFVSNQGRIRANTPRPCPMVPTTAGQIERNAVGIQQTLLKMVPDRE